MRRWTVVERVVGVAVVVALLVGIVVAGALVGIVSLRHAEARQSRANDVTAATLRVDNLAVSLESSLRGYILSGNGRFTTTFNRAQSQLEPQLRQLQGLVADDPPQRARAQAAVTYLDEYVADYAEPVMQLRKEVPAIARNYVVGTEDRLRSQQIRTALGGIIAAEGAKSATAAHHAQTVARAAVAVAIGGVILSVAIILVFGAWVARSVAAPVRRTSEAAARVAAGDFDVRVEEGAGGEVADLVAAFNSMTRSLELSRRELVEQNERLRESEQHKRDLISMVSHEIRTPLSSVIGFTALLLERDFPPEDERRYLEIVDQQARRLAALAGDFLDVQLLEGGGITLDRAPFDVVAVTREQVSLFFSHLGTHEVELDVPSQPVIVIGDRDRVAQVIGNLISNAIKYSPGGGTVSVSLGLDDGVARLAVTDSGIGIADADRDRVFDKFFRSTEAASTTAGTGLGLAVAREIVESHGGAVAVHSEHGRGSTFTVTLPVAAAVPA